MKFFVTDSENGFTTFEAENIDQVAKELAYDHKRYNLTWNYCTATDETEKYQYVINPDGTYTTEEL